MPMPSKPIRNKIAGYIARLKRMRRIEQEELAKGIVKKKTEEYVEKRNKRRAMMKGKIAEMKKMRKMMPRYL